MARMIHYLASSIPLPDLTEGSCVGSETPDDWHADIHRQSRARQVATFMCRGCPVIKACGEYALRMGPELTGIWGSMSERDRTDVRAGRKRPPWPT